MSYALGLATGMLISHAQATDDNCPGNICQCEIKNDPYCAAYCQHVELVEAYEKSQPWYNTESGISFLVIGVVIVTAVAIISFMHWISR